MKLPDYTRCTEINQLLVAMGITKIPSLPVVKFQREILHRIEKEFIDKDDINIGKRLLASAIPVNKQDITKSPGDLLEYKGRKVVAYIRDQKASVDFNNKSSSYRYHLCNCRTLQVMKSYGREFRYLATQRKDGLFEVHDLTGYDIQKGEVRLELCKNCIELLVDKRKYFSPFSLHKYFEKYDSYTPKAIKKIEHVKEIQTYQPEQEDYSREYRKVCNYRCQICDVDLNQYHNFLHLHHKDGNPANNERHNLHVLCVDCHSKQPLHGHMFRTNNFKKAISIIHKLRLEQGLLTLTPNED